MHALTTAYYSMSSLVYNSSRLRVSQTMWKAAYPLAQCWTSASSLRFRQNDFIVLLHLRIYVYVTTWSTVDYTSVTSIMHVVTNLFHDRHKLGQ